MVSVVIPRLGMAMRSISESSGRGPSSVVQNSDLRDFLGIMTASIRADLNISDRNDASRNIENTEDGNSPALKLCCGRQMHTHHTCEI